MMARLFVSYDSAADVLYVRMGSLAHTKNMEEEAGLVLRYDVVTHHPVGATILDYREYWIPKRRALAVRLADTFHIPIGEAERAMDTAVDEA